MEEKTDTFLDDVEEVIGVIADLGLEIGETALEKVLEPAIGAERAEAVVKVLDITVRTCSKTFCNWIKNKFKKNATIKPDPSFIIGSHDSGAYEANDKKLCLCFIWAKTQMTTLAQQFNLGVRLFDLRYKNENGVFIITHTFDTMYTLEEALTELLGCCVNNKQSVIIRLKRDYTGKQTTGLNELISKIKFKNVSLISQLLTRSEKTEARLQLYSDNNTAIEDGLDTNLIFGQIFDTVETWDCSTLDDAVNVIKECKFKNNGLKKVIWLDWSSLFPPIIASDLLCKEVLDMLINYKKNKTIDGIVLNAISEKIVSYFIRK